MKPKVIIVIIALVLLGIILLQNTQVATLKLFFWKIDISQMLLIFLTLFAGFISGFVACKILGNRRRKNLRR